jgi:hypothetical protein
MLERSQRSHPAWDDQACIHMFDSPSEIDQANIQSWFAQH